MKIRSKGKTYLLKLFNIQASELRKTLLLQLNIFLLITTLLIVKPTVNSIFLSKLTSSALPVGYMLTAVFALIGAHFYTLSLARFSLEKIMKRTLIVSFLCLLLFAFVMSSMPGLHKYYLFIPYIWVGIYGLLVTSQFWLMCNILYTAREAKRVFGFIGAGAIAGGIVGGYLTSFLAQFMMAEHMLYLAAALVLLCLPITQYLWKKEVDRSKITTIPTEQTKTVSAKSPIKTIRESKLLTHLTLLIGTSVFVAKLVDYQYQDYASRNITNAEELTAFFAFWLSTLSVVSLCIQLFFTKKVLAFLGVGSTLSLLPLGLLIGSALFIVFPELWVVVLIKIVDGSMKQSLNKAAVELSVIPIPLEIKKGTKNFIDVVVDSIATGIAGILLYFLVQQTDLGTRKIGFLTIVLTSIWIYLAFKIKKEYLLSLKSLLHLDIHHKEHKKKKKELSPSNMVETVTAIFDHGSEPQIIHMLSKTLEVNDERFFEPISKLLRHPSAKVRALAIENLYYLNTADVSDQVAPLIADDDQEVTTDAIRYLIHRHKKAPLKLFETYHNSPDPSIRNGIMVGLSQEIGNHVFLHEKYMLDEWIATAIKELDPDPMSETYTQAVIPIIQAIGNAHFQKYYPQLDSFLRSKNTKVAQMALTNVIKTKNQTFIPGILHQLQDKRTKKEALNTLYEMGPKAIPQLTKVAKAADTPQEVAIMIPGVIAHFNSKLGAKPLMSLIEETEHSVSIEAIEALKKLKWENPSFKITDSFVVDKVMDECSVYQKTLSFMYSQRQLGQDKTTQLDQAQEAREGLMLVLEHKLDTQLIRIFKFLGIKYPPNEINDVLHIITKGSTEQRNNALEFLDNILDVHLKKRLIPITESAINNHILTEDMATKLNLEVYSEKECYELLLQRKDTKLRHAVLFLLEKTRRSEFIPLVENLIDDHNPLVRKQARDTLRVLSTP